MRKLHLFMFMIGVCGTVVAQSSDAPETLAPAIDSYLNAKSTNTHPLAQHGMTFVAEGTQYKVNPRFLVAISGGETTFGVHICGQNNAFNWFWNGSCTGSPFDSWDSGIHTVAKYMQKSYVLHGYTTISTISKKYCTSGCDGWIPLVGRFYRDVGGDSDAPVIWNGAAPAQVAVTPLPGPVPVPVPVAPVTTPPTVLAVPTLTAQLESVTRSGFFLSSNRTVLLTVHATAENLGKLKPINASVILNGTSGSTVVASMTAGPPSGDGKSQYNGTVSLPTKKLENATIGVQLTLTSGASKKVAQTLHAADLAVPSESHMTLLVSLGSVLALLVLGGVIFAVVRARGSSGMTVTPAAPAVTK